MTENEKRKRINIAKRDLRVRAELRRLNKQGEFKLQSDFLATGFTRITEMNYFNTVSTKEVRKYRALADALHLKGLWQ